MNAFRLSASRRHVALLCLLAGWDARGNRFVNNYGAANPVKLQETAADHFTHAAETSRHVKYLLYTDASVSSIWSTYAGAPHVVL